jgi:hypothetical protein
MNPGVMVHQVTLYEAVCHRCAWSSPVFTDWRLAEDLAADHRCADALEELYELEPPC